MLAAAFPAAAQPRQPPAPTPWSVESPGPLGARFGLGLDLALDRLDDAQVVGGIQTVTMIAADGSRQTTIAPVDVGLTNRKHRQEWEERSFGFQAPLALPPFHLGALRVEPSLVLEAAAVEGELTFVDLVEGEPDRALDGAAARWGVGVEALGELCRGCRWFWSAGYRYRSLAGLDLGGEAPGEPGGPTVTQSVEIDHDSHHLTARLGALIAGGRATVYAGVRDRRSELEVSDETRVTSPEGGPNPATVLTRLDLDADDTTALAGADVRLGRGYVGRVEATFGQDDGVLLKVVRAHHWRRPSEPAEVVEERRRRAAELARQIVPGVRRVLEMLEDGRRRLERQRGSRLAWDSAELRRLLGEAATELDAVLDEPGLEPLQAWFRLFFAEARATLEVAPSSGGMAYLGLPAARRSVAFAMLQPAERVDPTLERQRGVLASAIGHVARLLGLAEDDELAIDLTARSCPQQSAIINLKTPFRGIVRQLPDVTTEGQLKVFIRGSYAYEAELPGEEPIACNLQGHLAQECKLINLWDHEGPYLICDFSREGRGGCAPAPTPRCPGR